MTGYRRFLLLPLFLLALSPAHASLLDSTYFGLYFNELGFGGPSNARVNGLSMTLAGPTTHYQVQATAMIPGIEGSPDSAFSPLQMRITDIVIQCTDVDPCTAPLQLYFEMQVSFQLSEFPGFQVAVSPIVSYNGFLGAGLNVSLQSDGLLAYDYFGLNQSYSLGSTISSNQPFSSNFTFDPIQLNNGYFDLTGTLTLDKAPGNSAVLEPGQSFSLPGSIDLLLDTSPEPGTLLLSFGVLCGLAWVRRRLRNPTETQKS